MSLTIMAEFWSAIKTFLATSDKPEAAEILVNTLIDNDVDPKEIRKTFRNDGNIINALGLHDEIFDDEESDEYLFDDDFNDFDEDEDDYGDNDI